MRVPLVYRDAPEFGFDIGTHTVKVVQLRRHGKTTEVQGYGYCSFPADAVAEGIVVDPEKMAEAVKPLLGKLSYGSITAKRIVIGLPNGKVFIRSLTLPPMNAADLSQAVHYEVEQYVPVPLADLYIDYEVIPEAETKDGQITVLMTAAPRAIIDSYIQLFDKLGLQIAAIEASMTAVVRALLHSGDATRSTLVMDIASDTSDLTIYHNYTPIIGSVAVGGEQYTKTLQTALGVTPKQANDIKVKFGIAPSGMREKVFGALEPQLQQVAKEARRMVKFYQERNEKQLKVESIVIAGGSAGMPGMAEYFQAELGLPLTVANPWKNLLSKKMQPVDKKEAPMYTTAIGLAMRRFDE